MDVEAPLVGYTEWVAAESHLHPGCVVRFRSCGHELELCVVTGDHCRIGTIWQGEGGILGFHCGRDGIVHFWGHHWERDLS